MARKSGWTSRYPSPVPRSRGRFRTRSERTLRKALLASGAQRDDALRVAERVRATLAHHGLLGSHAQGACTITASFGVATYPDDGPDKAAIIAAADRALYAAKRRGGNAVCSVADVEAQERDRAAAPSVVPLPAVAVPEPGVPAR